MLQPFRREALLLDDFYVGVEIFGAATVGKLHENRTLFAHEYVPNGASRHPAILVVALSLDASANRNQRFNASLARALSIDLSAVSATRNDRLSST